MPSRFQCSVDVRPIRYMFSGSNSHKLCSFIGWLISVSVVVKTNCNKIKTMTSSAETMTETKTSSLETKTNTKTSK